MARFDRKDKSEFLITEPVEAIRYQLYSENKFPARKQHFAVIGFFAVRRAHSPYRYQLCYRIEFVARKQQKNNPTKLLEICLKNNE